MTFRFRSSYNWIAGFALVPIIAKPRKELVLPSVAKWLIKCFDFPVLEGAANTSRMCPCVGGAFSERAASLGGMMRKYKLWTAMASLRDCTC